MLESVQELLLKLALQMARDDYETRRERQRQGVQLAKTAGKYVGRIADEATHQRIIALRGAGQTIKRSVSSLMRPFLFLVSQLSSPTTDWDFIGPPRSACSVS